jgi:hypothetical protein
VKLLNAPTNWVKVYVLAVSSPGTRRFATADAGKAGESEVNQAKALFVLPPWAGTLADRQGLVMATLTFLFIDVGN